MERYNHLPAVVSLYNSRRYKDITDLYSIKVCIEKSENKPVIYKFFTENYAVFSINAYYWDYASAKNCKKITSTIKFYNKEYINTGQKRITKLLVYKLYEDIIKKEIMVL
jgi:hypothetical protein